MQSQAHQEGTDPERQKKGADTTIAWVSYLNRGDDLSLANHSITERVETGLETDLSAKQVPTANRVASASALQVAIRPEANVEPEVRVQSQDKIVLTEDTQKSFQPTGFFNWLFNKNGFFTRYLFFGGCTELLMGSYRLISGSSSPVSCFVIAGIYAGILGARYLNFRSDERNAQVAPQLKGSDGD